MAASIALVTSMWLAITVVHGHGVAIVLGMIDAALVAWSWVWIPLVTFRDDSS